MFKIESYITPLLMGYLDKYVKLRPEDFQLSLWGGDAVLYNLDLRLDIIEKAVQLPIVFQSGHIHELRLHVPWTKLGSDPVVVTINTIECILKLRDTAYKDRGSRASSETPRKSNQKQKIRKQEVDLPPGYLQSLMNKIVNNVSIIVNNLILKFVEDDIVLSLNIKSAECYSVDKDWSRAFIELLAPDFVLRRTINFCDVTVCLDKRDASGKIENYQDPVVYRCSIASRLYTKYENMHSKYPLETKLNVYCEKLDLSLTDTQLPMLIRLIELCLALYYGTLEFKVEPNEEEPDQQSVDRETKTDSSVGEPPPEDLAQEQQSWTSWAWSYVPQILPDEEDEEGEPQSGPPKKPPPLIFTLGMYAYKMTVKFKLTEYLKEKAHYGPKKIVFKPFLYLESDGISMEMLMQGITFFDIQFGVTSVAVYSQGPCICGAEGEENSRNNVLLSGGDNLLTKTTTNYICQSLFDQQSPENLGIPISKILDFDEHKQVYTEQYGVQKFGFFWMDMLYSMVKPEEKSSHTSSRSSVSSQDESIVFIQESSLSRFVIGQSHLNVSSTTVHRIQKVLDAAYKYEYEPYSKPQKERVDESRPHPTEEQMKSLEEYIPTRTYHMTLLQPIISILSAEHAHCDIAKKTYRSSQQKAHSKPQQASVLHSLFGLQISSQRFDLQWTSPMYPRKLVQLVSKIAGPSSNLLHHCHTHTQLKLFGFQVGVTKVDSAGTRSPIVTVIPPTSGAMYTRKLLLTMYWTNSYLPKLERVYELPQISLSVSKPALHVVLAIVSSWKQNNPKPADILANSLSEDVFPTHETDERPKHAVLEVTLSGFEMKTCRNDMVTACSATLSSVYTLLYRYDGHRTSVTPIFSCPCDTDSTYSTDWLINPDSSKVEEIKNDCLMVTYQLPRNYDQVQAPAMVLMNVEGIAVCFSPVLQTWFSYKPVTKLVQSREPKIELDIELAKMASPLQTNLSQVSVPSSGSKRQTLSLTRSPTTGQQSTVPAGNQEPKPPDSKEQSGIGKKLAHIFPLIRVLQVQVEMKKACIFLPKQHTEIEEPSTDIVGNFQKMARSRSLCDTLVICLPRVVVQSAAIKPLSSIPEIPITCVEGSLVGDKIPWNVSLQNCSVYTVHTTPSFKALQLVKPASVSCTVGVSYKYTPPTSDTVSALGLCLHTDMRSVTASTSLEQVKLVMDISYSSIVTCKQAVSFLSEISSCLATEDKAKKSMTEPLHYQNQGKNLPPQTASVASVSQSDLPYTQTSGDITSLDTPSKELEILETTGEGVKLSLWLQWTLPKCEMRLYLKGRQGETKIRALLEDMTMSVDVQDVYSKLKLNVGAVGISHFQRQGGSGQWQKGAEQGILMCCRDSLSHDTHIISSRLWSGDHGSATLTMFQGNQPQREIPHGFISLTFTRALRRNVKKRLQKLNIDVSNIDMRGRGDIENLFYFNKYVSEVCLNIAPCDFILCLEPVSAVLCNLLGHLDLPRTQKSGNRSSPVEERVSVPAVDTCNLPLLYADISNVRIFIPGEATDLEPKGENSSKGQNCTTTVENDMFLFQVQSVSITPHADNPLPRYAVDKDLYQRALHLGITSESGAALSDTQFQVDIKGLSLTSGCWSDFLKHSGGKTASSVVTPSTQIPAVEWNSLTIREEHEEIQLFPLLSPCDLKLILAPALVNYTPVLGHNDLRASLVCGYGLEFNVVSDIDLHISTNQIHLMHSKLTSSLKALKLYTEHNDDSQEENSSVQDSGIGSEGSAATVQMSAVKQDVKGQGGISSKKTLTPVDLLLTAGRISCTLYTHKKIETETKLEEKEEKLHVNKKKKKHTKQDLEWRVDRSSEDNIDGTVQYEGIQFEDPYLMNMYQLNSSAETKVIPAGSTCIEPFLFLYITQPHTVLSCQLDHQKFETSCYDILVKGAAENNLIPVSDVKLLPDCSDFTEYWLETRPGQPHQSTGIPASLYTLTVVDFLSKPGKITLKLERPVKMNVSFPKIRQVEEYYRKLLPWQQKKSDRTKPSSNSSSSDMQRPFALFNSIDSIAVQSEQVVVAMETKPCDEKPEIITSFSNLKGQAEFHHSSSGEIDSLIVCSYMRDFLVKTLFNSHQLNMMGPCSVKVDGTYTSITQDDIHYLSQYAVTIATGLVTLHFGQEHALCLKMFVDHCLQFYKHMMSGTETKEAPGFREDTPATSSKPLPADFIAHSSKDDLRSGEFQYVMDTAGVDVVPRPGEIVFCNRDREGNSSMTWSYSEPRVISALSSTPVPFNTAGLEKVECVLQYWETLVQQFVDFEDIDLLENEVTEVVLPDIRANSARDLVAAQIWRVMIKNTNEEIVFSPASLAAAMKVDSCFIPSLIPVIQLGLTMEAAQLHLHNHVHCLGTETPTKLQPFFMSPSYQPTGEFAVISLDNVLVAGSQWQKQQARNQLQFSTLLNVDLLEYRNLTMEKVISQFELSGNCNLQNIPKSPVLDVDITCEPVTVRVGQGIIHNLGCSVRAWNQILHDEPSDLEEIIFCHYVICNDTQLPVRFGQVGTDENLVLQSREMHQYGWRSHKMKQELHLCLDGPVWKWCDAVDLNKPGSFVRSVSSVDQQYTLILTIKRISNLQNQIIISGLVTVSNRLELHMEVKVVTMETEHHAVAGSKNTIPSYVLEPQKIQGIKFRPWGMNGPWSKEVYVADSSMKENNLVKITSSSRVFHIWCRVIVHTVQNYQQIFVVLCPLYTVRSHLPHPLYINIDTSKLNLHEQIEAPGRGRDVQLQCPGGDVHQSLTFQFSANSGKSSTSVTLSTGLIDQLQKSSSKNFDPNMLSNYWRNDSWFEWPYTQNVKLEESSPKPDLYNVTVPEREAGNQPTIDLNVNLSELWPGFQTLLVDVTPAFMVNNLCDLDLVFMGNEDVTYDIQRGQTICPPKLESSFHVGVKFGDTVHMSEPVPVSEEEVDEQRYRNDLGQTLFIDSYVYMPIYADVQGKPKVYFLTISSTIKNHIRVISIREQFVVTNLTKHLLQACVFAVPTWSRKVNIPVDASFEISSHLGCPRDKSDLQPLTFIPLQFVHSSQQKNDFDQDTHLVSYLILKNVHGTQIQNKKSVISCEKMKEISDHGEPLAIEPLSPSKKNFDWTFPVRLVANESGCRMTTSLTVDSNNSVNQEALCITSQEKDGVTYITIQIDSAPSCLIKNHCNISLYYGQTLMDVATSGATLDTTIQEETELVNCLPSVPVNGAMYYTPPFLNKAFPQISDKHSIPKIHISGNLPTDGADKELSKVKWSNSIDLLVAADNFVSIPNVADVKVHVQQVAMVTHVTISPITKADVSAKEIRSRLKGKERTVVVESGLGEPVDVKIAEELKQALEIGAPRSNEKEKDKSLKSVKTSIGLLVHQLSFVVQNESSTCTKGEIVRLTVEDLFIASYPASDLVEQTGHHRNCLVCSIGDMQLDNQVQAQGNFDFPVVFVRQNIENSKYQSDHFQLSQMNILEKHAVLKSSSIIHVQIVFGKVNNRPSVIESVECAIRPLSFYIDDTFIFRCIKEAEGFLQVPLSIPEPLPVDILKLPPGVKSLSRMLSNPVTIGHFSIQPVSVMFSIHASLKLFIASDHTPLSFGKFEKTYLCTTGYQLVRVLVMHYASGALFRAGAVVGSLEILGNPTGLVRSIGTGVADFFRMPYRGLTRGPGAFVVGVSQGTSSMVKNITTGMLKSVTDFASSVSRNMDRLSLDGTHIRRQEESRRHRPDGVGEGLRQGLTGLGLSLLGAVAGLADQPIQSLIVTDEGSQSRTSTASGLVTGVGKGLVGIFTKPIGGAAEFVSQTGQGILHGTGLSKLPCQRMVPYVIDISSEPCGQVKYALKLLQTLPSNDILCCMEAVHIDLTDQDVTVTLILTPEILFVVNHEEDSQQQSFSILELECGVTQGDQPGEQPVLSIVWKDSQTFPEVQHEPSKTERVTAFVDAASKYIPAASGLAEENGDKNWNIKLPQHSHNEAVIQTIGNISKIEEDQQSGSLNLVEQLSDTVSDSSVEGITATLPQYDFKMSATNLAAFLAIFNITKHRLAGIGFAV